ncbi:TIGR01458 family HAD-type hydrolase [Allomesorhizobium camelthorni]|uniref:Phospholysine phosphohistidine inorganic pyrophosphate phosphatase n=1 Tax=Allomesorhizobium camelthorni TaxID=475069 RepID=A0A6G4WDS3_9HYPH|nr:TIGR01458 family HAD-type hydrolase [Mesorhizobium camelthorni]NGO52759.1 TIGR01458 family HAD-type hydrolase [Mesorhizobium camelthorni]
MTRGVLLDLAGVIYDGETAIPGGVDAVARLRKAGLALRFVSNTTRSSKQEVLERLEGMGLTVTKADVFTPAQAAREWLLRNGLAPYLLVHPGLAPDFYDLPHRDKRAVVIGDAGEAFTYAVLNEAFRELCAGAELLALATNRTFRDADGGLSLDAGPFVAALEFASLKRATVLGKPSPAFFLAALASMGCPPGQAIMVGDDAESDIAGALRAGLSGALLVRTGKYRQGDEKRFDPRPTATVADLAAATDWIIARRD